MQKEMGTLNNTFLYNIKHCYKKEGLTGFYKGMSFPLCSVPLINAVVFSFHELAKKLFNLHNESEMSLYEGILCGAFAGWANCIIVTPVELVKCRLQVQHENRDTAYYKGVKDCIIKTYKESGIKSLYKGNVATVLREVPAYAAQFGGYYSAKKLIAKSKKKEISELNNFDLILCGAVGGYSCWQFSYPQDVIKTLLQTQSDKFKPKFYDGGFYECGQFIYKTHGMMGFWNGYLPCTIRALIANAVLFVAYENSKCFLTNFNKSRE
jgi:solute carrier family 25 (mitochondrial carnitine/acylcarnitine transporter), member 20/29